MKLQLASKIANDLVARMAPHCHRIEIAGSIRRQRPQVKDVEIVCTPRWDIRTVTEGLFDEPRAIQVNLLHEWATGKHHPLHWIKPATAEITEWPVQPDGRYWRALDASGIKVDVFLTTPQNWGLILLIRTGSAEFSQAVVTHAQAVRRRCLEGRLHIDGLAVETPEEADVFRLLGLRYIEPAERDTRSVTHLRLPGPLPGHPALAQLHCASAEAREVAHVGS